MDLKITSGYKTILWRVIGEFTILDSRKQLATTANLIMESTTDVISHDLSPKYSGRLRLNHLLRHKLWQLKEDEVVKQFRFH